MLFIFRLVCKALEFDLASPCMHAVICSQLLPSLLCLVPLLTIVKQREK